MSPFRRCLSRETSSTTLPESTVELFQSAFLSVEEMTYFGMLLNLSAKGSPFLDGQAPAKPSYVTGPSKRASASRSWSSLNLSPACPRGMSKVQPAYLRWYGD